MAKDRTRNDERSRIAHLAARIMVEDGISDYATAKRKAARQAGATTLRQLPTNDEIDAAVRTHQALFEPDVHVARTRELRTRALEVMDDLERFNPYLTGPALAGNAGKYADLKLQLYTDSPKAVELYLIERDISYRAGQSRLYFGEASRTVPVFTVDDDGLDIELVILTLDDLRQPVRTAPGGKVIDRAGRRAVEALLDAS